MVEAVALALGPALPACPSAGEQLEQYQPAGSAWASALGPKLGLLWPPACSGRGACGQGGRLHWAAAAAGGPGGRSAARASCPAAAAGGGRGAAAAGAGSRRPGRSAGGRRAAPGHGGAAAAAEPAGAAGWLLAVLRGWMGGCCGAEHPAQGSPLMARCACCVLQVDMERREQINEPLMTGVKVRSCLPWLL